MLKEIWPNFFIVGAPRAGTTTLYKYLRHTPGVYMPSLKEPKYFAPSLGARYHAEPILRFDRQPRTRSQADYLNLFQGVKDEAAIGEASPLT